MLHLFIQLLFFLIKVEQYQQKQILVNVRRHKMKVFTWSEQYATNLALIWASSTSGSNFRCFWNTSVLAANIVIKVQSEAVNYNNIEGTICNNKCISMFLSVFFGFCFFFWQKDQRYLQEIYNSNCTLWYRKIFVLVFLIKYLSVRILLKTILMSHFYGTAR